MTDLRVGRITPGEVLEHADTAHAVEIGERIWWFVCQHQDPDIAAALPDIDRMIGRDDAAIVTHWRAEALLKHYALRMPFWLVDEHSWQIDLGGRVLRFVLTPYLHFPGAFVSFDDRTGILFSSDLFGGFSDDWSLVAGDESCFDAIRPFHEHYMPSRDILARGLARLDPLPIRMIAPQHGSLIPENLVAPTVERLADIECGLYLMVDQDTDIRRLSQMNEMLREVLGRLMVSLDFEEIASGLLDVLRGALPVSSVEFYAFDADGGGVRFEPTTRYRGTSEQPPEAWAALRGITRPPDARHFPIVRTPPGPSATAGGDLVVPLFSPSTEKVEGLAVIHLDASITIGETTTVAFAQMSGPLLVALEREQLLRASELRREELYQLATHDPLTGLHSRSYLRDATDRLFALDDRMTEATLSLTMIDLDRFKRVNDSHGHAAGDEVLRRAAAVLRDVTRGADVAVHFGGEEFLLLQMTPSTD